MKDTPNWKLTRVLEYLWGEMNTCPDEYVDAIAEACNVIIDARHEVLFGHKEAA